MLLKIAAILLAISLSACSANSSTVKTTTSPIDGVSRTVISGSDFSISYIYPADGEGMGVEVAGGSVTEKEYASIVFSATQVGGIYREAFFKADGVTFTLEPTSAPVSFTASEYGVISDKEFLISCDDLLTVAKSSEVYLRITYVSGFVDYSVSEAKYGADGFGMIKKIASYCE
tara:strand:+ start:5394 stop:5915 length:522 start_codon:yes stop_codon:yes gene_type:complete